MRNEVRIRGRVRARARASARTRVIGEVTVAKSAAVTVKVGCFEPSQQTLTHHPDEPQPETWPDRVAAIGGSQISRMQTTLE